MKKIIFFLILVFLLLTGQVEAFPPMPASSGSVEDDAYGAGWNGDTGNAPSQNAVYDQIQVLVGADVFTAGADCSGITSGGCLDTDDGFVYSWDGDSVELVGVLNWQPLESTLTDIADGTITENLVNTANPWADNEVDDTLTIDGSSTVDPDALTGDSDDDNLVDGDVVEPASATEKGTVELATDAETATGTDTARAVTPASIASLVDSVIQGWDTMLDELSGLSDPDADRLIFWDDSETNFDWLSGEGAVYVNSGTVGTLGTAWRVFYNNGSSVPTELALGADGTYLKSNGAAAAPTWESPAGAGTMTTIKENDAGVGDADIVTLDFLGADFDLAESPDTEIQVVIAAAIARVADVDVEMLIDVDGEGTAATYSLFDNNDGSYSFRAIADGDVPNDITIDTATLASTVTISDDENTDDAHEVAFTTDNSNLESDGDFTYNPNSGTVAATEFSGGGSNLTGVDAATGDSATGFFDAGTIEDARIHADIARATGDTYTGTHDFSSATANFGSNYRIPNGTNPTTDAAGEIANDTDDGAMEVYSSKFTASVLTAPEEITLPPVLIYEPDEVDGIEDEVPIFTFIAEDYPHGATIRSIHIWSSATCTDALNFEEHSNNGTTWSNDSTVEAITMSGVYTEDDGTLSDATIAADATLFVDLADTMTDIAWVKIQVTVTRTPGD